MPSSLRPRSASWADNDRRSRRFRLRLLVMLALAAPLLPRAAWARVLHITIENVAFGAVPPEAHVGDVIVWSNKDFIAHTATARDGSFDVVLPPYKSARVVLKHPGVIDFYCRYHPGMAGQIRVKR